jgi:threonine/homoserine/homoserine lactone efflux protein
MLTFLATAVLISLSGVMAPGPITAVAIGKGSQNPHAGAFLAVGHGFVEIPLMTALLFGLGQVLQVPHLRTAFSVAGSLFLLFMAVGMLRPQRNGFALSSALTGSPLILGILLTLGNPYFFVWWGTIGANLILGSVSFGPWGFVALAGAHWTCDLTWDYLLSASSFRGGRLLGPRFQQIVLLACAIVLFAFALRLLAGAILNP